MGVKREGDPVGVNWEGDPVGVNWEIVQFIGFLCSEGQDRDFLCLGTCGLLV